MKKLSCVLLIIFSSLASFSQEGSLQFPDLGFSIQPLEPDLKEVSGNHIALQMFLPTSEEFAPNVNVIVQRYEGSIEEYKSLSDGQFESLGVNMIKSELKDGIVIFEYTTDKFGSSEVHIYTRGYMVNDKVYLATGTRTIKQWKKMGNKIMSVVNSLDKT